MKAPLISIITPNFNKAPFLEACIHSVLNQDYPHWELLIIDDHSTDNSWSIIEKFAAQDTRIKPFQNHQSLKGGSAARNLGITQAQGNYIVFLDSDDLLAPFCLSQRVNYMERNRHLDWSVYKIQTFYQSPGDQIEVWFKHLDPSLALKSFLSHDLLWTISSTIWKASSLQKLHGFNTNFPRFQDVELHTRALLMPDFCFDYDLNAPVDMYYRIDPLRSDLLHYAYCLKHVEACSLFITNFKTALEQQNVKHLVKYLKGTLLESYNLLLYAYQSDYINTDELFALEQQLFPFKTEILGPLDRMFLNLYLSIRHQKIKIKGLNFLLKKYLLMK